jgi:hypothetical protein
MRFAKWVFLVAGVYGVLLVTPIYFLEDRLGQDYPPPITHPEFFYGFLGAALAWQVMYLLIGLNPARYRTAMLLAAAAKVTFVIAVLILYQKGRVAGAMVGFATPDAVFGLLFVAAWLRTPKDGPKVGR